MMKNMSLKKEKGLTLVELIIVVSLIAALAIIAISYFRGQLFKGNDAKRKADINRIKVAVEEYEKDHDCYPLAVSCNPGTGLQPYLDRIPCDPLTHASYYYEYQDSVCPAWYRFFTKLDNSNDNSVIINIGPNSAYNYVDSSPNAPSVVSTGGGTASTSPSGTTAPLETHFYGCRGGSCVPILWDSSRPGPECDPNYQNSSCYHQCDLSFSECVSWK